MVSKINLKEMECIKMAKYESVFSEFEIKNATGYIERREKGLKK